MAVRIVATARRPADLEKAFPDASPSLPLSTVDFTNGASMRPGSSPFVRDELDKWCEVPLSTDHDDVFVA
jgi:hypothetical protein